MARHGRAFPIKPHINYQGKIGIYFYRSFIKTLTELTTVSDQPGYSLNFDGASYVTSTSFAITNADGTITLAFWTRCSQQAAVQYFFSEAGAASSSYLRASRAASSDDLQLNFATGAANSQVTAAGFFTGYNDTPVHVAIVADYTNKSVQFYRNGSLFTTQTTGSTMNFPSVNRAKGMGQLFQSSSGFLTGYMDELRVYNRSLSSGEISSLYGSGQGFRGIVGSSCVLAWNMDEGTGTTTADSSGNSRTGTLTGATWAASLTGYNGLLKSVGRVLSESFTTTQTFIKSAVRTLSESTTISDVLTKVRLQIRDLLESFTASDSLIRAITRNLTESASITDSLPKATGRTLNESTTATDTLNKTPGKTLTESASITDSIIRAITKVFSEATTITDTRIIEIIYGRILTETIAVTDTVVKGITKILSEALSFFSWIASWFPVSRSTDATYNPVSRSSDASYNQVNRASDNSWNQVNRDS